MKAYNNAIKALQAGIDQYKSIIEQNQMLAAESAAKAGQAEADKITAAKDREAAIEKAHENYTLRIAELTSLIDNQQKAKAQYEANVGRMLAEIEEIEGEIKSLEEKRDN